MPIKWSAIAVSEAMDAVEQQVSLAAQFFAAAREKAHAALSIPNLPEYMGQRIGRLVTDIDRIKEVRNTISSVRELIPDGAIEREKGITKHGTKQPLF